MLVSVELAGPCDTALYFVEHQHQIVVIGQLAQAVDELVRTGTDAALALDRLDEEAGSLVAHQRFGVVEIVEFRILEPGKQRHEAFVHLLLVRGADRRHRPPVECVGEGDQFGTLRITVLMLVVRPRRLDRRLDRFGTRIGEEHRIGEGLVDQHLRQFFTLRAAIEVGDMHQGLGLALDRPDKPRMAVAEQVDGNPAREIEIARAILVDQMTVLALHGAHAAARVDGHQR